MFQSDFLIFAILFISADPNVSVCHLSYPFGFMLIYTFYYEYNYRMKNYRADIIQYAKRKYKTRPEHLWARHPNYVVLRRDDNAKWYGIIMDVPRVRLGLGGDESVDILNVKCDAGMYDFLRGVPGILRGYHMGGTWVSVLLDGTIEISQIKILLDNSYNLVCGKKSVGYDLKNS